MLGMSLVVACGWFAARPTMRELLPSETLTAHRRQKLELSFAQAGLRGYRIDAGRLWVPESQHADYLAAAIGSGALPPEFGSHVERVMSQMSVFESPRARQQQIQWAMSQDLAVMIRKLPHIEDAEVLYDAQPETGFRRHAKATALVTVQPLGNARLTDRQAEVIRQQVAAAFRDLSASDVQVIDVNEGGKLGTLPPTAGQDMERQAATDRTGAAEGQATTDSTIRNAIACGLFTLGFCGLVLLRWLRRLARPPTRRSSTAADPSLHSAATLEETIGSGGFATTGESATSGNTAQRAPTAAADPERPFACLQNLRGQQLLPLLRGEHSQTVAVVLSNLDHEQAAEILMGFPASLQSEILRRLADMDILDPLAVEVVEQQVSSWLRLCSDSSAVGESGMLAVRGIVDAAGAAGSSLLLSNLRRHNHALVDRLAAGRPDRPRAPLGFAQLVALDSETLRAVLRDADAEILALALATSEPEVVARVAEHLPGAEATQLLPAIHQLGPTRLSDVGAAQQALCDLLHRLEREGRIRLPASRLSVAA